MGDKITVGDPLSQQWLLCVSQFSRPPVALTQRKGDNLLQKQEQEELQSVCEVMEDLIRMQGTIFTVSLHTTLANRNTYTWLTLLRWLSVNTRSLQTKHIHSLSHNEDSSSAT